MSDRFDKTWSQTYSGGRFRPLHPEECAFEIEDIARGLSNACRYNGQVRTWLSVAEHSVHVSRVAQTRSIVAGESRWENIRVARWGLLHDASEAYLGDIPRPLKHLPEMQGYRDIEAATMAAIAKKFGLEGEEPAIVKALDSEILGAEVRAMLPNAEIKAWSETWTDGVLPPDICEIYGWDPLAARALFLERFYELWGRV